MDDQEFPREKNWKHLYLRSEKLHRSKQLGSSYPRKDVLDDANVRLNVLFVCSRNQWRSPTAEKIYSKHPLISARSCGTSRNAKTTVTKPMLQWADVIIVMEEKHRSRLLSQYPGETKYKEIDILDIPDEYKYMDPELIDELKSRIDPLLFSNDA